MARNFTAEELVVLRYHLEQAHSPNTTTQMSHILPVLEALVNTLGESGDLALLARKRFEEVADGAAH